MRAIFWLPVLAFVAAVVWAAWYVRRKSEERRRAEEARVAAFMMDFAGAPKTRPESAAAASPPASAPPAQTPPARGGDIAVQKLLFEAAHKAAEAGEPGLSVQLLERLLARYPATTLAEAVRAALEAQRNRLAKG
jgi:hypothetical protein